MCKVRELDLSRCKIRELEGLQGGEFCNLRELNLDSNLLSDAAALPRLPALAVLRLNHNTIATPTLSPPAAALAAAAAGGLSLQQGIGSLCALEVRQLGRPAHARVAAWLCPLPHAMRGRAPCSVLQVLQLGYNQISDLPALRLHGLLALKVLHLQGRAAWHTHKCRRAEGPAHPPRLLRSAASSTGPLHALRRSVRRPRRPPAPAPGAACRPLPTPL